MFVLRLAVRCPLHSHRYHERAREFTPLWCPDARARPRRIKSSELERIGIFLSSLSCLGFRLHIISALFRCLVFVCFLLYSTVYARPSTRPFGRPAIFVVFGSMFCLLASSSTGLAATRSSRSIHSLALPQKKTKASHPEKRAGNATFSPLPSSSPLLISETLLWCTFPPICSLTFVFTPRWISLTPKFVEPPPLPLQMSMAVEESSATPT